MLQVTIYVVGPLLLASLAAGLLVGIVQTATQVNEPSVSFLAKTVAVITIMVVMGGVLVQQVTSYARRSFASISDVVR
jgi:flagellar biosynthetic protein FliQ